MTKSWLFIVILAASIGVLFGGSPIGAQSIPELTPSKIIRLPGQSIPDKSPVITGLAIAPAGKFLATAGDDHQVRLWDLQTQKLLHTLTTHTGWVRAAIFRPDGKVLATAGDDRQICFWDATTGTLLKTISNEPYAVHALSFSPSSRTLAVAGFGDKIRLHDGTDGRLLQELDAPGSDIRTLAFSPDGTHLAAAGRNGVIRIWDASKGKHQSDLQGSHRLIHALVYSPDGAFLASAGEEPVVRLWDTADGTAKTELTVQTGAVLSLSFCGKDVLAAGTTVNEVHAWTLPNRQELCRMTGHTGSVATVAWNARGGELITSGFDCTVRYWQLTGRGDRE
jgi:WD40 repeat protein